MGKVLIENQGRMKLDKLRSFAERLSLDIDAWERCLDEPRWQNAIDEDVRAGRAAGVASTPTFFVNGLMVPGAQSYERFVALVEQELSSIADRAH